MHLDSSICDFDQSALPNLLGAKHKNSSLTQNDNYIWQIAKKSVEFKFLRFVPYCCPTNITSASQGYPHSKLPKTTKPLFCTEACLTTQLNAHPSYLIKDWRLQRFINFKALNGISRKILGIMGVVLPLAYFATSYSIVSKDSSNLQQAVVPKVAALDSILANKQLTVATVDNATTYFARDGFEHGFGYDVLRAYADQLHVDLKTVSFANESQAIAAVKNGRVNVALTNMPNYQMAANDELTSSSLTCQKDFLSEYGLDRNVAIQINKQDKKLLDNVNQYLCNKNIIATNKKLAAFYTQNVLDTSFNQSHFDEAMTDVLPQYQSTFRNTAKLYDLDWQLLVAMSYQESHLNAEATSPTGVRGIMMLTNDTAKAMGVTDRINASQSIQGGAKYFRSLQNQFSHVQKSDRVWFTLAAYNMGPQAVKNIQEILAKKGKNADSWAEVYRYMSEHRDSNTRFEQCINYVTNIRGYLETLKLDSLDNKKIA